LLIRLIGIFVKVLPLAPKRGVRIVLVNRRDYPSSDSLSDEELEPLRSVASGNCTEPLDKVKAYLKDRGQEVWQFLGELIKKEKITIDGGIILAGWSFGNTWMLSVLANHRDFLDVAVDPHPYIKKVMLYGGLYESEIRFMLTKVSL
jgi:hypothetical protein